MSASAKLRKKPEDENLKKLYVFMMSIQNLDPQKDKDKISQMYGKIYYGKEGSNQ
jgi:hypothetical protein